MSRMKPWQIDTVGASNAAPALLWNSTLDEYLPAPLPPVGITIQDENVTIATGVIQIDFQGAGVSAANGSGEVVVTIPIQPTPIPVVSVVNSVPGLVFDDDGSVVYRQVF